MRTPTCLCLLLICMLISCTPTQEKHEIDYTSYVNPFIGTDFTGNTYPGAQAPFGMVQLSPDNGLPGWDRISGYFYPDSTIAGFSHTHLSGTGAGDLYDISFMPVTLPYKEAKAPLGIHSKFSHDDESAYAFGQGGDFRLHLRVFVGQQHGGLAVGKPLALAGFIEDGADEGPVVLVLVGIGEGLLNFLVVDELLGLQGFGVVHGSCSPFFRVSAASPSGNDLWSPRAMVTR